MFTRFVAKSRGALLLALVLLAAACGSSAAQSAAPNNSVRSDASTASAAAPAVSSTMNSQFGTILTDGSGRTLYFFDNDKPIKPQSSCTGSCVKVWPILSSSNGSSVGAGVDATKLGHIVRTDGQTQLTYNNWPLYTFSGDSAAGQTNGQGIQGIWHVAGVDGKPITTAALQPGSAAGPGY
jgi:predicted lipoprotein with Yx(FWY)xxD motif